MMTSDYVTGKLNWNTALVGRDSLREAKGKGPKPPREPARPRVDASKLKLGKTSVSDLDTLVNSMESQENLPSSEGTGTTARGTSARGSVRVSRPATGYGAKPTPKYDGVSAELDRLVGHYLASAKTRGPTAPRAAAAPRRRK